MSAKKRALEETTSAPKAKKVKLVRDAGKAPKKAGVSKPAKRVESPEPVTHVSTLVPDEIDFPRGGGTSFTPLEVKAIRQEGMDEANEEVFQDNAVLNRKRRKSQGKSGEKKTAKSEHIRVEHLNYKRLFPGMKVLGQVFAVYPLAVVISLPDQLFGHVPITNISSQLSIRLEALDDDDDDERNSQRSSADEQDADENEASGKDQLPELLDMFRPGQYVCASVVAVHSAGTSAVMTGIAGRPKDEVEKASRRVELSLVPALVNESIAKADIKPGLTLSAAVQSVEDHGYILDLGIDGVSGFLPNDAAPSNSGDRGLQVGVLLDVTIAKGSKNGRTITCSLDPATHRQHTITELSNVASVLPGMLVQTTVTAVLPNGLNLQVLGFLEGTVDEYHCGTRDIQDKYQVGQKMKARVLCQSDSTSTPPRFALSLAPHVVALEEAHYAAPKDMETDVTLPEAFPIGTILEAVEIRRVEPERGLIVEVASGLDGFIHISQVSDDHVPTLPPTSGPWKVGTIHRARVTGYVPFDGLLKLSLRASVLAQKFLQVSDVRPGELVRGVVKRLTDRALFVSLAGAVDGVVWPTHYADITLKHPQKRFKPGSAVRARVLAVDPARNRIVLTAKKTLVDSELPVLARWEDVKVGAVAHGVVFRINPKSLQVEFYNTLKAVVPIKEVSETFVANLEDIYSVGKPVKVRIISVDAGERKMLASIRQAGANVDSPLVDVGSVEVGHPVEGEVTDVHKDNVILTLKPSQVRALHSLANLANHRSTSVAQLRSSLEKGQLVQGLVVVSRNAEKGFVIVASKPKAATQIEHKGSVTWDVLQTGQIVGGRVVGHARRGASVKLGPGVTAALHPTDCADEYDLSSAFPAADTILKAVVLSVDKDKRQIHLSTRASRMHPEEQRVVVDREVNDVQELKEGEMIRGFIKSIADHGLFVSLGRSVDARVQIKEMFDDYVKDWKARFKVNQLVKGRIINVNADKNQIEMSFRSDARTASSSSQLRLSDLAEGQKIHGRVKKVEDYGLFIEIEGSKLSGLCHKSQLSDNLQADVTLALRSFQEGDSVKAIVLSIDHEKRRISLGLKPSYFSEDDFHNLDDDTESEAEDANLGVQDLSHGTDNDEAPSDTGDDEGADDHDIEMENVAFPEVDRHTDGDEDDEDEQDMDHNLDALVPLNLNSAEPSSSALAAAPSLQLRTGFQWAVANTTFGDVDAESAPSEEEDKEVTGNRKKKSRKEIQQDLTADMHTKTPQSISDFERLLLGSPNSSYLWIQYMSFQLQLSEVDKAREVARRALRSINFREEQEKLNVWVALLNLENIYGTEETLESTFKDAARGNDSKTVHLRLAAILDQSDKADKAEEQYKRTTKKFGQSSKVWTLFGEFCMRRGKLEDARKMLPRSLQSLEKRKHLKTISRFAQLEYRMGDPERGKTIFEGIVDSHPKRLDLWSVYIDMEAMQKDIASIRNIFGRVLTRKLTSHKAKAFFKKWLELERRLGNEEGENVVKKQAVEWTQRASSSS